VRNVKQITQQVHRKRATAIIGKTRELQWLLAKTEILDALGRIDTDFALLVMARRLCELKPSTAEAIEMISRHREFDELADEMVHVIRDYTKRHPNTSRADILRALETAGMMLGNVDGSAEPGRHQFLQKMQKAGG